MRVEGFYVVGYEDERGDPPMMAKFQRTFRNLFRMNMTVPDVSEAWGEIRSADRYLLHRDAVREARRASERLGRKVDVWKVEVHAEKENG